jgi:hypothetical protein
MRAPFALAFVASTQLLAGCTSLVAVKPAEVVKLSGAREQSATVTSMGFGYGYGHGYGYGYGYGIGPGFRRGGFGLGPSYGTVTTVTLTNVETVDGRIEAIPSLSEFDLVFKDGGAVHVEPPLDAHVEEDALVLASRNVARASYPLASISHAEFRKTEQGKTTALVFGITFGVLVLAVGAPMVGR